jgi:hypothetical protein
MRMEILLCWSDDVVFQVVLFGVSQVLQGSRVCVGTPVVPVSSGNV